MADPSRTPFQDILVLAPNWLGDVVMTTPLLTWLADRRAEGRPWRLHLGIRRAWAPLFTGDPRLDGLVAIERRGRHAGLAGIPRQAALLRRGRFDVALVCPPSLRSALVTALAGIPRRIGYRADLRGMLLTDGLPMPVRGRVHYAREMLALGSRLLGEDFPEAQAQVSALPGCDSIAPVPVAPGPPLIAFAPGATYGEAKTWPAERAAEFLTIALEGHRHRIVLLGDAQARPLAQALAARVGLEAASDLEEGAALTDLTGRTDLAGVAAVLKACRGFVGNDSGLMHLAGALEVPTVGVFGSSNPDWTAPLGPRTAAVAAEGYPCRPCYRKTCNQPRFCLEDVSAGRVMDRLAALMATEPEESSP